MSTTKQGFLKRFFKNYWGTIAFVLVVIVGYAIATDGTGFLNKVFFPSLSLVTQEMLASSDQLFDCFASSMGLLIPGFALALVTGVLFGLLVAMHPAVKRNAKPIIFFLAPIPPSILTPYLIAVMPTFYWSSVAVIFLGCFWPILAGTIDGVATIEQGYLDNAAVLELKGPKKLFYVVLPAAASHILSGADMALNFSFILLVVAEMLATDSGLGYFVQYYADFSDYPRVIGGLIFMAIVVVAIKSIFELIKRKVLFWNLNDRESKQVQL